MKSDVSVDGVSSDHDWELIGSTLWIRLSVTQEETWSEEFVVFRPKQVFSATALSLNATTLGKVFATSSGMELEPL